jgi:hypothetical protein
MIRLRSAGTRAALLFAACAANHAVLASSLEIFWIRTAGTTLAGNDSLVVDGGGTDPGPLLTSGLDVAATPYLVSYTVPPSGPTYSSSFETLAGGTVAYGYMSGVVAASLRTTYGYGDFARASYRANWTDMVTLIPALPALVGTPGTASGSVLVDVLIDASVTGFDPSTQSGGANESSFSFGLSVDGNAAAGFSYGCALSHFSPAACGDGLNPPYNLPERQTVSVPFTFSFTWGTPFELFGEVVALSLSSAGPTSSSDPDNLDFFADGSANFLSTVLWQGIDVARDAQGNPVGFSVTSDSATDWAQPATAVPAPGALVLFATAFAGLRWSRFRRRTTA